MSRMVIFVFYDFEGMVDEYVIYLLQSLKMISEKIVIVSNANLNMEEKKKLEVFTEYIYERENKGFDAGAYKDIFTFYLKNEEWDKWDEVIMLNDSFYGPMYPWQEVFEKMDYQDVDFWGMTKAERGIWMDGIELPTHIQSYFLAVRKRMILSEVLRDFWENMEYPEKLNDAVINFEARFTDYFYKHNFKYVTYMDVSGSDYVTNQTELPYVYYIYELLTITRMPLVKRKALAIFNFVKAYKVLQYISANTGYDIELIKKHIRRLDINRKISPLGYLEIDAFCERFSSIYVYGNGKVSNAVSEYLQWRGIEIEKYIVSEKSKNDGNNVISYKELDINNETGIILALGDKNSKEVLSKIIKGIPENQLLVPRY